MKRIQDWIHFIFKQNLLTYKSDNDHDLDNIYEIKSYYRYCTIMLKK